MATVVNDRDVLIMGAVPRFTAASGSAILIAASAPAFTVASSGTPTPSAITFSAVRLNVSGAATFTASDGATLTVNGDAATLAYANMPANSTTVTVSVTEGGTVYSRSITVSKVFDAGTTYTWLKYADDAAGNGISDSPTGKTYIGFATNKSTATESNSPADYTWALIKGGDGLPGPKGADGQTTYMWVKYSDYADGTNLYDVPNDDTVYIGIATNKLTATESTNKADYVWSRFKGAQGVAGTGARGPGWFYAVGSAWSDTTAHAATPGDTQVEDTVTISDGTVTYTKRWNGSTWIVPGAFMDGSLFVEKSITAAKINANGLEIRDPQGNLILGAGSALRAGYEAPGTKNSEQTLGALGHNTYRVASMGLYGGGPIPVNPGVYVNGETYGPAYRSYTLRVIERSSGSIVSSVDYNVADNPAKAGELAAALNALNGSYIVIVYSHEDAKTNRLSNGLEAAMYRCGASRSVFGSANFRSNSAYILIGIPGCGEGGGAEAYAGANDFDPNAWCDVGFGVVDGAIVGVSGASSVGSLVNSGLIEAKYSADLANNGLADKLSKTAGQIMTGYIALQTGGGIVAGSLSWNTAGQRTGGSGTAMTPIGLFGHNGTNYTFTIDASTGKATFADELAAAYGSFGALRIANGGYIAQGSYSGAWAWPAAGALGWLIHPNGMLFGDYYNNKYFQLTQEGNAYAPGFKLENGQLTLTNTIIIDPQINNLGGPSLTLSSSPTPLYFTYTRTVSGGNAGTITASAGGTGPFTYAWAIEGNMGNRVLYSGNGYSSSNIQLSVNGGGAIGMFDWTVTCTVTDSKNLSVTKTMIVTVDLQ